MSEPEKRKAIATEDWRESVKQMITERNYYQYMRERNVLTDCTFVVGPEDGETREFKAHRGHVARMSPVFEAMFLRSEMSEAKTGQIRVTDISSDTFQYLLDFIYDKRPQTTKTFQELQDLATAADKYQMKVLLERCLWHIRTSTKPENIWSTLEIADLFQNKCLKDKCVKVLQRNTLECITDPGFLQTSEENVALLLEQDELNVDDEPSLVNSVVHWARHAARQRGLSDDDSGVRAVLEPRLLSLFRFLAMSPQQFIFGPGLADWITSDEKSAIVECLRSKEFSKLPQHLSSAAKKRSITVQTQVERSLICKREVIDRRPNVQQAKYKCCEFSPGFYLNCLHATLIFSIPYKWTLLGFQCASRYTDDFTNFSDKNPVYQENLIAYVYTFLHRSLSTKYKKIIISEQSYDKETKFNSTISIMFDKPISLKGDSFYAIEVLFRSDEAFNFSPPGHYPNPFRAPRAKISTDVELVCHTEQKAGCYTSVCDGIIESIIFSK